MTSKIFSRFATAAAKLSRRGVFTASAALFLFVSSGVGAAYATAVTYTSFTWTGIGISISQPAAVTGGAGQIQLNGVSGAGDLSSILAWCLDIFHSLQNSGAYELGGPTANGKIGGLMLQGDAYLAQAAPIVIGSTTYDRRDVSAATQVAIWSLLYTAPPAFAYDISNPRLSDSQFASLVSALTDSASSNVSYYTLTSSNGHSNQMLGTVAVPGPIVGVGLPGLIFAGGVFVAWLRRKKPKTESGPCIAPT